MKNNLLPNIDLTNSRDYYSAYNTQDLYKGKSFNMSGEWRDGTHYFNDDSLQNFVSYQGALLSCNKTHIANYSNKPVLLYSTDTPNQIIGIQNSMYWNFVLGGIPGKQGDQGEKGTGISYISDRTSEDGTKEILVIGYGDGEEEVVEIPHGKNGTTFTGIKFIDNNTYEFNFIDENGSTDSFKMNLDSVLNAYYTKEEMNDSFYQKDSKELKDTITSIIDEKISDASSIDGGNISLN